MYQIKQVPVKESTWASFNSIPSLLLSFKYMRKSRAAACGTWKCSFISLLSMRTILDMQVGHHDLGLNDIKYKIPHHFPKLND